MIKNRTKMIIPAVMLCIVGVMILSVFSRLLFHNQVMSLGDDFIDSETGLPYYADSDCYYHLRMTRDIALYGHPGDTMKDGVPWDSFSYAPEGRNTSDYRPLMAYIAIAVNRLVSIFAPHSLEQTVYWLNIFLSALVVVPVFLLTFEMCGLTGAIVASVLSALNYIYLAYTLPGYYDTDGVITWVACFFFYFGVKLVKGCCEKNKKSLILNGIGFVASFIALYHSWYIYYMYPGIFVGAIILFMLLTWKKGNEKNLFSFAPILLGAGISTVVLILEKGLFSRVISLFARVSSEAENSGGVFSNVYASINELQNPPLWPEQISGLFQLDVFSDSNLCIINCIGGIVPFLFALVMCGFFIRRVIRKDVQLEYPLLLIWYAVTLVLSFRGWRFIALFAVPAAIFAGNLAGTICGLMDQRKLRLRYVYRCLILVLLLLPTLCGVYGIYRTTGTAADEVLWTDKPAEVCLRAIRENTPEDTILASWWDYGYFLEEKGRRRTLFDGGTQTGQRTFFVSRAFSTEDEELSANIFRMLAGSGDKACELMFSTFGETEETLLFMDELLSGCKTEAWEKLLRQDISEDLANEITGLLFPESLPLTECVITTDMPWYAWWYPIFGRTMTEKEEKSIYFTTGEVKTPIDLSKSGRTVVDIESEFYVILEKGDSGWHARASSAEEPSDEQPVYIDRLIFVDDDGSIAYAQSNEPLRGDQDSDDEIKTCPRTVIIADDGQETTLSLVSSSLADSVFGRLVYLRGEGLTRYKAEPNLSTEALVYRITE